MIRFSPSLKSLNEDTVVFLSQGQIKRKEIPIPQGELKKEIFGLVHNGQFLASAGEIVPVFYQKKIILLVGLGQKQELSLNGLRCLARQAFLSAYLKKRKSIIVIPPDQHQETIASLIESILIGMYQFDKHLSEKTQNRFQKVIFACAEKKYFHDIVKICEGVNFARDLVNDNADTVHSEYVEKILRALVRGKRNISLKVLGPKELKAKGLNLILGVNKGSSKPAKLIIAQYRGGGPKEKFIAICGKGITFDTGGLNIKPTGYMETMRLDMGGAAAVLGALKNVIALNLKKNILFVVGVAENVIGSRAQKPGDVVKSYSGKTVEIANTDAEGRLVLADAISYVIKNYKPGCVIDLATLTGACVVALGYDYSGLLSNNDPLAKKILAAAEKTNDQAWQLPLYKEVKDHLKSQYADLKNTGLPKGAAGTISAAEFIRQFVGKTPWAHLDIAGTAFVEGPSRMYFGYGATGSGVRLLTRFLSDS